MNKIATIVTFLACTFSYLGSAYAQEQKTLFCAESISYVRGKYKLMDADTCKSFCSPYSESSCLTNESNAGWNIVSSSATSKTAYGDDSGASCSCVGTQYALRKEAPKPAVVEPDPAVKNKISLLEKEIELLKKENGMLQSEKDQLRQQLDALQSKQPAKKKP
jgi:hypothetical protein